MANAIDDIREVLGRTFGERFRPSPPPPPAPEPKAAAPSVPPDEGMLRDITDVLDQTFPQRSLPQPPPAPGLLSRAGQAIAEGIGALPRILPPLPFTAEGISIGPEDVPTPADIGPLSGAVPRPDLSPLQFFGQRVGERLEESGQRFLDVARALATLRPTEIPGRGIAEKALSVLGAAATPFEPIFAPIGAGIETAARGVGLTPEASRLAAGVGELAAGVALPFIPTGGTRLADLLSRIGIGRTPEEIVRAEQTAAAIAREAAASRGPRGAPPPELAVPERPPAAPIPEPTQVPTPPPDVSVASTGGPRDLTPETIAAAQPRVTAPPAEPPVPPRVTGTSLPAEAPETSASLTAPTTPTASEIAERMRALRTQVEDARTALPTGKQFGKTEEGQTIVVGKAKSIREQLSEEFPELRDLPKVGPKEIVEAIDKDRSNKLYLAIRQAVEEQLAREKSADYEAFAAAVDELAAREAAASGSPVAPASPPAEGAPVAPGPVTTQSAEAARRQPRQPQQRPPAPEPTEVTAPAWLPLLRNRTDRERTAKVLEGLSKGVTNYAGRFRLTFSDPADQRLFNLIVSVENPGAKPGQFVKGRPVGEGKAGDAGLLQWSPETRERRGLPDNPTPKQEQVAFLAQKREIQEAIRSVAPELADDPATIVLGWRRGPGGVKTVLREAKRRGLVGQGEPTASATPPAEPPSPPPRESATADLGPESGPIRAAVRIAEAEGSEPVLTEPRLSAQVFTETANTAAQFMMENKLPFDRSKGRILEQLTTHLSNQPQLLDRFISYLDKANIDKELFLDSFYEAGSEYGKGLNVLSQIVRRLEQTESTSPAAARVLSALERVASIRRRAMIGQLATAVRNFETQAGRLVIESAVSSLESMIRRVRGVAKPGELGPVEAATQYFELVASPRANRELAKRILEALPSQRRRLEGTYFSDVDIPDQASPVVRGLGKVLGGIERALDIVNAPNRLQEMYFRDIGFLAKLEERLRARGITTPLEQIDPRSVPISDIREAVTHALDVTFANEPVSEAGKAFVNFFRKIPFADLAIPFPRFLAQATKFQFEHSPLVLSRLLSAEERAKIAAGDTRTLAKASIGTTLFLTGWLVQESEYGGDKPYELKVGDKSIDMRPFNPFTPHLVVGWLIRKARRGELETVNWSEVAKGLASVNLRAGAGMFLLDQVLDVLNGITQGVEGKGGRRALGAFAGEVAASFLTPLRTLTDVLSSFVPEEAVQRSRRHEPFLGPIKEMIPGLRQTLPERHVPTEAAPPTREFGILRQLTGIPIQTKTAIGAELDRLGLASRDILPTTGNPEADNAIAAAMGPLVERTLAPLIARPSYVAMPPERQRAVMATALEGLRRTARTEAFPTLSPGTQFELFLKSLPPTMRPLFLQSPEAERLRRLGIAP